MDTHGGGGVPDTKAWRKQQKMKMVKRKLRYKYIPNDIVLKILPYLPAKSLVRFRWACKYWFNLITSDYDFIKMHLHCSATHTELFSIISPSILCTSSTNNNVGIGVGLGKIVQCHINYIDTSEVCDIVHPCYRPLESVNKLFKILGSCNGLLLILIEGYGEELCIWNPCTKEYRILPGPPNVNGRMRKGIGYGFGYDQTIDDYKVIRNTEYDTQVYTLGTNAWRWIGRNPFTLSRIFREGVFVNGALYWMEVVHNNIISFDLGKEKFQRVSKLPYVYDPDKRWLHENFNEIDIGMGKFIITPKSRILRLLPLDDNWHDENVHIDQDWYDVKLQVFEGSLCMVLMIKEEHNYRVEMWVMNGYTRNNNESLWTKLATISNATISNLYDFWPRRYISNGEIKPLRYMRNGEILMLNNDNELFLYNPKTNKTRIFGRISTHHNVEEVYLESLVRLNLNSGTYASELEPRKELVENNNKELMFSLISNQNKILFREYMRRSLANQNKKKIVFKEKLWQGRRRC